MKIGKAKLGAGKRATIVGVMRDLSISKARRAKEEGAEMLEVRIDLLSKEEREVRRIEGFVEKEKEEIGLGVIATNRRKEEGGGFEGKEEERIEMLMRVIEEVDIDAVDIEFFADGKEEVIKEARRHSLPVIISYHDFEGAPSMKDIEKIVEGMYADGGDIAKIAVTPRSMEEALSILQFTLEHSRRGKKLAIIGMGHVGKHLRVIAPIYGSVLTYGFIEGDREVAPAQLSIKELKNILDTLFPL
ncbi:MAG: type I 3-dehydroquinate dehydratase [Candidatus Methanospirareceae archaeon]